MKEHFPRRSIQRKKGNAGQSYFQHFVENDLGWIFHPINEQNDFGIDGYVEIVLDGCVTGKLIGIQVKHGDSFFASKTPSGYTFVGENKHLNYYLNNRCPVVIVILDDGYNRCLWQEFDLALTSPAGEGWSIEILAQNRLGLEIAEEWVKLAGAPSNFEEEIKWNWELDRRLLDRELFMLVIPRAEVNMGSFETMNFLIGRLSKNVKMRHKLHSTIEFCFPEYADDPRELFEVPEIIKWIESAFSTEIPLAYFLNHKPESFSLSLVCHCLNRNLIDKISREDGEIAITYSPGFFKTILDHLFNNLNVYCDKNNIPERINKEISKGIFEYYRAEIKME